MKKVANLCFLIFFIFSNMLFIESQPYYRCTLNDAKLEQPTKETPLKKKTSTSSEYEWTIHPKQAAKCNKYLTKGSKEHKD